MKDKIYYYDRNGVLKLTLNQYPYYTEWADLRDWQWGYNEQFGRYTSFRRDKHERELIIAIAGDYLKAHDDLCDIFAADIIAGQPGQLRANDWTLNCYITEAEYEYGYALSRKAVFKVVSEDPSWIRKNTRVLSGESAGESETDYGRDYTEGLIEAGSDTAPYLFRQSPQFSNGYNNETDTLVGGSVAWNQLVPTASRDYTNTGVESYSSIMFFFRLNASPYTQFYNTRRSTTGLFAFVKKATATGKAEMIHNGSGTQMKFANNLDVIENHYYLGMINFTSLDASTIGGVVAKDIQLIDLTQMFGSTIADAIYAMEQSTAGSGVAWFKKLFPNSYYPYNSGELKHVSGVSAHVMRDADNNVVGNYALDSTLTLRGIPKLSNGKLYYDGDIYEPDGTVTRRYGIVDLGSLSWIKLTASEWDCFYTVDIPKAYDYNLVCSKYARSTVYGTSTGKIMDGNTGSSALYIRDTAYTSASDFKTAMTGVYLVYELETPTTETAEPYTNPQVVDESGTEEYVSTSIVPVGHQTAYGLQAALRGYNYGYSLTDVHTAEIVLPSSQNGYEVLFYGPITNPAIYLNGHPVQVYVTLTAWQRLRVVSNGSEKTIKILSSTGVETDAFIYRSKEYSPFIDIGQYTEVSFGDFRFDFTTIERRSEPTWT